MSCSRNVPRRSKIAPVTLQQSKRFRAEKENGKNTQEKDKNRNKCVYG